MTANQQARAATSPWPYRKGERERHSTIVEIWQSRELLRSLTVRNLKVKYKRSALGFVWTLVNPLVTVGVLVIVFSGFVRLDIPHYWAFLVSGYFVWNFVSMSLNAGTRVLGEHASLARSVRIPGHVFVLAAIGSRLFEFLVEISLVLAALAFFHHGGVPVGFAALPILIGLQTLLVIGLVLPIATLSAFYDDVQHMLPVVLMIFFYLSPVFYPLEFVPEHLQGIYRLNPMVGLLSAYQTALYEGRVPDVGLLSTLVLVVVPLCIAGFIVFNRFRRYFVEIL